MSKQKISGMIAICCILSACGGFNKQSEAIKPSETTNKIAEANFRLGVAYLQREEYEKSLIKLQAAQKADKEYSPIYDALGVLYQRLGDNENAEKFFKKSLSLNPSNSPTLNNYGQFLCQQRHFEKADALFLKALENPLYETPETALNNAGICALRERKIKKAAAYFRRSLERNPHSIQALIKMSELSYEVQNYLSARAYLQRYIELAPHTAETLWLGIRTEQKLGDLDTLSSYTLLLRNKFPDSKEAHLLNESLSKRNEQP